MSANENQIVVYQPNETVRLDVRLENETVWLSQSQMATLFGCSSDNIGLHLKNVYAAGELVRESTTEDFSVVRMEGSRQVRRNVTCYNLDAIISVGYRVNSILGVKFRQWATSVLKEYLLRGYSFNARMNQLEDKVDRRLAQHDQAIVDLKEKVDFFVQTKEPPLQSIFYQNKFWDTKSLLIKFIRRAKKELIVIDAYPDVATLDMLSKRGRGVKIELVTHSNGELEESDFEAFGAQCGKFTKTICGICHDRFIIVDQKEIFWTGASLKDAGRLTFASRQRKWVRKSFPVFLLLSARRRLNGENTAKASRNRGDEMNYVFYKEKDGKVIATETVSEEDIKRVDNAAQDVMRVYRVEEIFHMIMSALLEFNSEIFQRADLGRIAEDNVVENELLRIRINQCAATFLTALDMYHEYLKPAKAPPPFSIPFDKFKDSRFAVCKAVRNYIQHVSTVGVNISWGGSLCACGEKLCSFSVSADAVEMRRNINKMHESSRKSLNEFIDGKTEINLYEIFNGVVDVLFDIQKVVRESNEYAVEYKDSDLFLSQLHERLRKKGFFWYRYECDEEVVCRGEVPYFYERQRDMISFLSRRYSGGQTVNKYYATTAPQEMVHRMAEADRIVERYVKGNGVVAELDKGAGKITSSKFTTKKMRDWYLQKES